MFNIFQMFVLVTIVSAIIMVILFASELNYYLTREIHPELFVDTAKGQKLKINIDVSFPEVGCSCEFDLPQQNETHFLNVDSMLDLVNTEWVNVDSFLQYAYAGILHPYIFVP